METAVVKRKRGSGLGKLWEPAEDEMLIKLIKDGYSSSAIAVALNCTGLRVRDRVRRLGLRPGQPEVIERKCLTCGIVFGAETRTLRMCPPCRANPSRV